MLNNGLHVYVPGDKALAFVNTVAENKEGLTKRQIKGAEKARQLYSTLAYPSLKDFKWAVMTNQIANCPITVSDIDAAQVIWGKDVAALKGKTTRQKPLPVQESQFWIPTEFLSLTKHVLMSVDIFFVNKIIFFLTYTRKITYTAVSHLSSRKLKDVLKAFLSILSFYGTRGFSIREIHADPEFEPLKNAVSVTIKNGPEFNLSSAKEHVSEIERRI